MHSIKKIHQLIKLTISTYVKCIYTILDVNMVLTSNYDCVTFNKFHYTGKSMNYLHFYVDQQTTVYK